MSDLFSDSTFILEKCHDGIFFMVRSFSNLNWDYDEVEGAINLDAATFNVLRDSVINGGDFETGEVHIKFLNDRTILVKISDSYGLISKKFFVELLNEIR